MRIGKVYYNLEESEYETNYKRFTFVFSSRLYYNNFNKRIKEYSELEQNKIKYKYNVELEISEYLALSLYKKIEKRGFMVYFNGKRISENETFVLSVDVLKYL